MKLMLATMAVAIVLGVVLRNHERLLRLSMLVLSFGVTAAYYLFSYRFM